MKNDILFKVRMADRSSVKFILKDKKLYVFVGSEEIGVENSYFSIDGIIREV